MYKAVFKNEEVGTFNGLPLYELEEGYGLEVDGKVFIITHYPTEEDVEAARKGECLNEAYKDTEGDNIVLYVDEDE